MWARLNRMGMRRVAGGAAALLLVAGIAIAASDDDSGGGGNGAAVMGTPDMASTGGPTGARDADAGVAASGQAAGRAPQALAGSDGAGSTGGGDTAPVGAPGLVGPKIVRTAELQVKVGRDKFERAFANATAVAGALGGFVTSSSSAADAGEARPSAGTLTLKIPADRFDEARRRLAALGDVQGEQIHGEDVTAQAVDLDARLQSLKAQEDALRVLMGKAGSVGETLQVQDSLFNVRTQIEQLTAQRDGLTDAVALSTITVFMGESNSALALERDEDKTGLGHDLSRAVEASGDVVGGMIIAIGYALPIAVLLALGLLVARLRRHPTVEVATVEAT
jgi:hypothetical protein